MKKYLKILAWIFAGAGLALMFFGTVAALAGGSLFNHWWYNYFYPAVSFILSGIFLLLMILTCKDEK